MIKMSVGVRCYGSSTPPESDTASLDTEACASVTGEDKLKGPQEPEEQNVTAGSTATAWASLRHHVEDFENDAFVRRVSLFSRESNEQAALKTQGAVPVPEKAIWTSNSCGPGQLNASLIVITWCNDSQSKYSLQAITKRTRGTHYVLHYVSPTESEQCSMKKFPPRYCDSLGDGEELFRAVIHPKCNSL